MSHNPFGAFKGRKSHVVMAGTNTPVLEGARDFGRLRTGGLGVSGGGRATAAALAGNGRTGGTRLFSDHRNSNGDFEINASSNNDLIQKIASLVQGSQNNTKTGADRLFERQTTEDYAAVNQERAELLASVQSDRSGRSFQVLGEVLGEEVYETLGREGFSRNCLLVRDLGDKEIGRVKVRKKDVVAQISTTNINARRVMVRQYYVYPGEYYLQGYISIEEKEIAQAGTELLDDKYQDLLEQIMVQEDKHIKSHLDDTVGTYNPLLSFNTFTPTFFMNGKINVDHWGVPCVRALMAWDIWPDIAAEPEFANWFDPVTKHELVLEGKLGAIMDVQLITDAFRYDTLRVLEDGEIYFLGAQVATGVITQRRPLQMNPTDRYNLGQAERGYFGFQIQGTAVFPRAVAKAQRVSA